MLLASGVLLQHARARLLQRSRAFRLLTGGMKARVRAHMVVRTLTCNRSGYRVHGTCLSAGLSRLQRVQDSTQPLK
jgi:hypothetical protein